jgi:hypothetical protein
MGLGKEHPVKGIFMIVGKPGKRKGMLRGYGKRFKSAFPYPGHEVGA